MKTVVAPDEHGHVSNGNVNGLLPTTDAIHIAADIALQPGGDGASESDLTEIQPRRIGRYELRREIGRGSMGVVYEARDPMLERTVAVKMIQIAFATSPEEYARFEHRFLAEARIAARLSHPGIVVVHDVGQDAGTGEFYIAMEHLEGRVLSHVLRSSAALPWRDGLRITARIAEALHYAHTHGVVHRDIKPANIMVLASGEPKVMDFGIARMEAARDKLEIPSESICTPLYASPEQVLGEPVDGRSDLFSLGAIAYALLTGRAAFAAGHLAGIVARVIGSDPAPPSSLAPDLPPEVDRVIARMLAKNPAARYQNGAALGEDIADLLTGLPPRHANLAAPPVETRFSREWDLPDSLASASDTQPSPSEVERRLDMELDTVARVEQRIEEPITRQPAMRRAALLWLSVVTSVLGVVGALAAVRSPTLNRHVSSGLESQVAQTTDSQRAGAPVIGATAAGRPPTPSGRQVSSRLESQAADKTHAQRPGASTASPRAPARLSISFQRPPRGAGVRVWVDGTLVAEQRWVDRPAERTRLVRFGADGASALRLEPGGHDVKIEVAWDGKRCSSRIWSTVKPGAMRQLRARIGGVLKKHVSLEWE